MDSQHQTTKRGMLPFYLLAGLMLFSAFQLYNCRERGPCTDLELGSISGGHSIRSSSEPLSTNGTFPRLCVVARTYPKRYSYLPAFLLSVVKGTDRSPPLSTTVILVVTETTTLEEDNLLADILRTTTDAALASAGEGRHPSFVRMPVSRSEVETLFPLMKQSVSDWGYSYTDVVTDKLAAAASDPAKHPTIPQCDYILYTNADNLYSSRLGEVILPHLLANTDIVAFDMISGHKWPDLTHPDAPNGIFDDGSMKPITVKLRTTGIDLGASIHRFNIIRDHDIRFLKAAYLNFPDVDAGQAKQKLWTADGAFVDKMAQLSTKKAIIRQTIFMHQ